MIYSPHPSAGGGVLPAFSSRCYTVHPGIIPDACSVLSVIVTCAAEALNDLAKPGREITHLWIQDGSLRRERITDTQSCVPEPRCRRYTCQSGCWSHRFIWYYSLALSHGFALQSQLFNINEVKCHSLLWFWLFLSQLFTPTLSLQQKERVLDLLLLKLNTTQWALPASNAFLVMAAFPEDTKPTTPRAQEASLRHLTNAQTDPMLPKSPFSISPAII